MRAVRALMPLAMAPRSRKESAFVLRHFPFLPRSFSIYSTRRKGPRLPAAPQQVALRRRERGREFLGVGHVSLSPAMKKGTTYHSCAKSHSLAPSASTFSTKVEPTTSPATSAMPPKAEVSYPAETQQERTRWLRPSPLIRRPSPSRQLGREPRARARRGGARGAGRGEAATCHHGPDPAR